MKAKQDGFSGDWTGRGNPLDDFLTEDELTLALKKRGIRASKRTLRDWRQRRRGPPFSFMGMTPIYPKAAFAGWLSASTTHPQHSASA